MTRAKISVLIPTLRAQQRLRPIITALHGQTVQPFEIIVIDSDSDDGTADLASALGCTVYKIRREDFDHGGTRNLAACVASGDVLLFMTDDAVPSGPAFVENLTKRLGVDGVVAAYARQVARSDASVTEAMWRAKNYPPVSRVEDSSSPRLKGLAAYRFSNVASAILKEVFDGAEGFPGPLITNEDMLLCSKLLGGGFKVAYEADAVVVHSHNFTLCRLAQRYFDMGVFLESNSAMFSSAKVTREGLAVVVRQAATLLSSGQLRWIPRCCIEALVRVSAYRVGTLHRFLPGKVKRLLSANKGFWKSTDHGALSNLRRKNTQ